MLNRVILMGRISQDIELKQTPSGVSVLSFNVAVERSFVKQGEERQADFISCVAWRQQAEFISKYFSKGRMIALEGNLRTRNYEDKNGSKHYVTEVYVDSVSFTGEAKQSSGSSYGGNSSYNNPNSNGQQNSYNNNNNAAPAKESVSIGDFSDFEEVLSDDGVPF
ncbi:MAG: single-stranded DNA-binding protein [Bacteroidales bacterium]|nr:single-stranded DNA-binding protein [Bacteroidales bacterium]